jgi:hypothetical protein
MPEAGIEQGQLGALAASGGNRARTSEEGDPVVDAENPGGDRFVLEEGEERRGIGPGGGEHTDVAHKRRHLGELAPAGRGSACPEIPFVGARQAHLHRSAWRNLESRRVRERAKQHAREFERVIAAFVEQRDQVGLRKRADFVEDRRPTLGKNASIRSNSTLVI